MRRAPRARMTPVSRPFFPSVTSARHKRSCPSKLPKVAAASTTPAKPGAAAPFSAQTRPSNTYRAAHRARAPAPNRPTPSVTTRPAKRGGCARSPRTSTDAASSFPSAPWSRGRIRLELRAPVVLWGPRTSPPCKRTVPRATSSTSLESRLAPLAPGPVRGPLR